MLELRGPKDVANLGHLLGLNEEQCNMAVKQVPLQAIESGKGRTLGPYRAHIQSIKSLSEAETWKIPSTISTATPEAQSLNS